MTSPTLFQSLGTDWSWDGDSLTKVNGSLFQLESSSFLVCFKVLLEVLSCLRGLTLKLQMEALDVLYAYKEVRTVVSTLKSMRSDSERVFKRIYAETTKLGKDLHDDDFELKQPRICGWQTHWNNLQADTPEQYYRITFFNEFLSHTIAELDERFINHPPPIIGLLRLLPRQCCSTDSEPENPLPEELVNAAEFYEDDLPVSDAANWIQTVD